MTYFTLAVIAVIALFLLGWKLKWAFKKIIITCICIIGLLFFLWFINGGINQIGVFLEEHVWNWFLHLFS